MSGKGRMTTIADLLTLFIEGYKTLEPRVGVDDRTAAAVRSVVSDLVAGREVSWIRSHPNCSFLGGQGKVQICAPFLGFLEKLHYQMTRAQVYAVSRERALVLLYNNSADMIFGQPFLGMDYDSRHRVCLITQPEFVARFGKYLEVTLQVETLAEDFTVFDRGWDDPRGRAALDDETWLDRKIEIEQQTDLPERFQRGRRRR